MGLGPSLRVGQRAAANVRPAARPNRPAATRFSPVSSGEPSAPQANQGRASSSPAAVATPIGPPSSPDRDT